jgi:putative OPT family oligopeptide transporter
MVEEFEPYIPADQDIPEFTLKAIVVGLLITVIMGAANAYLGLFVGMTVSATIPSLVFALAILKFFKGNILEINMAKNIGVAGEALAAGIIFTFPAMVVIHQMTGGSGGWVDMFTFKNLMIMIVIALIGGLFGILFTIPLRKVFIDDLDLPYPEGVAAAEVLKAMEKGGRGVWYIAIAAGIGGVMKISAESGFALWREKVEGVLNMGRLRFFGGVNISPALLGVGYIIGFKIAFIVFSGGILGWVIAIPLVGLIKGWPAGDPIDAVYTLWFDETKWIGIGAVLTGGVYTLIKMYPQLKQSIIQTVSGKKGGAGEPAPLRTERDFHVSVVYLGILAIAVFGVYLFVTSEPITAIILTVIMFIATFLFTAVAGYLAGIVGSSNNPISSVTITTLVITALVLIVLAKVLGISDMSGAEGMGATILVAAIVCCSAAIAGDSMQELKTAQILGATPVRIQWGRFIGVAVGAIVIPFIVGLLAKAYGIGTPALPSPQAVIMGSTVYAIFNMEFNYIMFTIGVALAIILILWKKPIMAVAIGIYLPFTLTTPIFLGGVLGLIAERWITIKTKLFDVVGMTKDEADKVVKENKEQTFNMGLLFAAGLVAGEAVFGVIVALIIIIGGPGAIALFNNPSSIPGLFGLFFIMFIIIYMVIREHLSQLDKDQSRMVLSRIFRR